MLEKLHRKLRHVRGVYTTRFKNIYVVYRYFLGDIYGTWIYSLPCRGLTVMTMCDIVLLLFIVVTVVVAVVVVGEMPEPFGMGFS